MRLPSLFAVLCAVVLSAAPAVAETKAESCTHQANLVAAVQQARLDGVRERKVPEVIAAQENTWPDRYNTAIPLIAPWVYEQKRKVLRKQDLGAAWNEMCLLR